MGVLDSRIIVFFLILNFCVEINHRAEICLVFRCDCYLSAEYYANYLINLYHGDIVIINEVTEDEQDLMQDFVSLVINFCAKLYGKRRSKRKIEELIKELSDD